jgi:hypothetical protein
MLMKAIDHAVGPSASFPSGNPSVIVVCSNRALPLLCIHLASIHLQDLEHSLLQGIPSLSKLEQPVQSCTLRASDTTVFSSFKGNRNFPVSKHAHHKARSGRLQWIFIQFIVGGRLIWAVSFKLLFLYHWRKLLWYPLNKSDLKLYRI